MYVRALPPYRDHFTLSVNTLYFSVHLYIPTLTFCDHPNKQTIKTCADQPKNQTYTITVMRPVIQAHQAELYITLHCTHSKHGRSCFGNRA